MNQSISFRNARRIIFGACGVVAMLATGQPADAQHHGRHGIGQGVYSNIYGGNSNSNYQFNGNRSRGLSIGINSGYGGHSGYGSKFGYGNNFGNRYRNSRYGWGSGHAYGHGGIQHGVRRPVYHDTSHYDYHRPRIVPHGNHFDLIPGHYNFHRTGHWDH